jgi:MoaA/NifB/PqqE/SkfB family radical SAM enzyme
MVAGASVIFQGYKCAGLIRGSSPGTRMLLASHLDYIVSMSSDKYSPNAIRTEDQASAANRLVFDLAYPSAFKPLYSNVNFVSGYCFDEDRAVEGIKLSLNGRYQSDGILSYPRADVSERYPQFSDRSLLSGFNAYFDSASLISGENKFDFHIRAAGRETNITKLFRFHQPGELRIADIFVDIVGPCNLKCAMCPQGILERAGADRGRGFMSVELFERVVSYLLAQSYSGKHINLYNWGDPLLHPELGQILDICHTSQLKAVVSTNLSFPPARVQALTQHPIDLLLVSVSGFSPETYAKNHAGGRFALVRRNLEALQANRRQIKSVVVKYLLFRYNVDDVEKAKAFCENAGFEFGVYTGAIPSAESFFRYVTDSEYRKQVETYLAPETITLRTAKFCPQNAIITMNHRAELERCCVSWGSGRGSSLFDTDLRRYLEQKLANEFCARCLSSGYSYYKHFGIVRPETLRPTG